MCRRSRRFPPHNRALDCDKYFFFESSIIHSVVHIVVVRILKCEFFFNSGVYIYSISHEILSCASLALDE